jgi:HK97 family phage portal protein
MAKLTLRLRLARAILGRQAKEFIPPLSYYDRGSMARLNDYRTKADQLEANLGWCFAANNAIAEPAASVKLKLYRKRKDGKREEIFQHELLELLEAPNLAHTGEQMRNLHFTYMNYIGESYTFMRSTGGNEFIPAKGKLPAALEIFPAHLVQFKLGEAYTKSTVKYAQNDYPLLSCIRDLNPDPAQPYFGRSIIRAAAMVLDTETQMKEWNRGVFARGGHPSMIVRVKEEMTDDAYRRFRQQIDDEVAGTENAHRPLIVEGDGDATPYMMSAKDLDFLASRKFSMTEILSMWRVSAGMLGQLENANRSNLDAAFTINAIVNVKPRIRQFVNQWNVSLVKVYDPLLELGFEDPVPEDIEANLKAAQYGVNRWWTIDEVREQYGDKPLPDELGSQIYMANNNAKLADIAEGVVKPQPVQPPNDGAPTKATKAKKRKAIGDVVSVLCECCDGMGEHDTGFECYRCDASGWCTPEEDKAPIPCNGAKGKSLAGVKKKT